MTQIELLYLHVVVLPILYSGKKWIIFMNNIWSIFYDTEFKIIKKNWLDFTVCSQKNIHQFAFGMKL